MRKVLIITIVCICIGGIIAFHNGDVGMQYLTISDFDFSTATSTTSTFKKKSMQSQSLNQSHCVVHIHGFHHSGTGFLRKTIYDGVGGSEVASMHEHTGASEDEGQHLQTVYPTIGNRTENPSLCIDDPKNELPQKLGRLYYCPNMIQKLSTSKTITTRQEQQQQQKERLFHQWSQQWNLTKPILIQKTPSFDMLFLEKMKLHPTTHLLIMRHPMVWNHPMTDKYANRRSLLMRPLIWIDVWATILEQLARGDVQSYAVVLYETINLSHSVVVQELSQYVRDECPRLQILQHEHQHGGQSPAALASSLPVVARHNDINDNNNNNSGNDNQRSRRRRLHLWTTSNTNEFQKPKPEIVNAMKQCQADRHCRSIMNDLEPIFDRFLGYTWNIEQLFRPLSSPFSVLDDSNTTTTTDDNEKLSLLPPSSHMLFSSNNPPPEDLVRDMLDLKAKYC